MGKNEVIEVVAEAEELVEHKGYLYLNDFLIEQSYFYSDEFGDDSEYVLISRKIDSYTKMQIALYLTSYENLPKYNLRFEDMNDTPIESFYFENFLVLNQFLSKNPFFKLIFEASQCD